MIDFTPLTDRFGDAGAAVVIGALVGLAFGLLAQRSGFCARSAVIGIARGSSSPALLVWLAALGSGVVLAMLAIGAELISLEAVRLRAEPASLSGAIVGGVLFGVGMVLARGCASRHLVLAASGNLRAIVTFGLFAAVALATIAGPLVPVRQALSGLWMIGPQSNDAAALVGLSSGLVTALGGLVLAGVVLIALLRGRSRLAVAGGALVGAVIVAGWVLTSGLAGHTFEPTQVETAAFTAPAANVLRYLSAPSEMALTFDVGLIPGAFIGALVAAVLFGDFRLQWFASARDAVRYAGGAVLMGFGGVLAIGCTVGSLGNAVLMITSSWAALIAILIGGIVADRLVDARGRSAASAKSESGTTLEPSSALTV